MEQTALRKPPIWKRLFDPSRILAFFTILNFLVYFDRGAVAGLLSVIDEDYDLDEVANGFLSGAFMIGYILFYFVFNFVSSETNLPLLLFIGLISWSIGTITTVWAPNFQIFLITRMLTGAAEASYAGVAPVYLDDNCPQDSRFLWLSLYYVSIPIGAAVGMTSAGYVDHVWEWEYLFAIEGAMMLPLSFLSLAIPSDWFLEYSQSSNATLKRGSTLDGLDDPLLSVNRADKFYSGFLQLCQILKENKIYLYLVLGKATFIFYAGAFSFWMPHFIEEEYDLSIRESNLIFGITTFLAGLFGACIGGSFLDSLSNKHVKNWTKCILSIKVSCLVVLIAVPISVAIFYVPNETAVMVSIGISEFLLYSTIGALHGCTISSLPAWLRPFGLGFSVFVCHLLGDFPAALVVGFSADATGDLSLCLAASSLFNLATVAFWFQAMRHAMKLEETTQSQWSPTTDYYRTHG